jgi:hypothetical protein
MYVRLVGRREHRHDDYEVVSDPPRVFLIFLLNFENILGDYASTSESCEPFELECEC